jgi:hypothetical protein
MDPNVRLRPEYTPHDALLGATGDIVEVVLWKLALHEPIGCVSADTQEIP